MAATRHDHVEIAFLHDRQADCILRPNGHDQWGSLPHLAVIRGLRPDILTDPGTGLNRGGLDRQIELAARAIEHSLNDLLTGPIDWWDGYLATARVFMDRRLGRPAGD